MVASNVHGKGKRWQARYIGPDGQERTSLWRTKPEAEREITKQESSKLDGSWVDPERGKMPVERVALDIWLPATSTVARTRYEYEGVLKRYLVPEWGGRQIRSIRPSEAGAWQNLLTTKYELTGQTPNRVARLVRSVFRLAVIDRMIPVSPFDGIRSPTAVAKEVHPPDIAQVIDLLEHAPSDLWRTMVELTAITGLRCGEIRGLRLPKIDFLRRELHVHQQLVYDVGSGLSLAGLKTGAGRRTIPLNQRAIDLLAAYVAKCPPPTTGEWEGLVFTMASGTPIWESSVTTAMGKMSKKAGLEECRWHDLRHHYASVLISGGENPKVVQKRLGHASVVTTLQIYSHLFAEAESKTRSVIDGAWTAAREAAAGGAEKAASAESSRPTGRITESGGRKGALTQVKS
ncbi:tyrosine-type recombinase/integrase [Streptomyces nigra]|uniref:tyrosine-type recombinase/integrase n=1 Tax=Streptomyces nigra TaxID=1827580 RepID=UPI0037F3ED17